jgi:hypothetical protein
MGTCLKSVRIKKDLTKEEAIIEKIMGDRYYSLPLFFCSLYCTFKVLEWTSTQELILKVLIFCFGTYQNRISTW